MRKNRNLLILLIFFTALLSGCKTMSRDECAVADWHQVGYKDGSNGQPRTRIEDHARACSKEGIAADRARFFAGHDQGLLLYCTPANGFRVGREGRSYSDVCPPPLAQGFLDPYRHGSEIHKSEGRINGFDSERKTREQRLQKLAPVQGADEERRRLRDELADIDIKLRRERDRLRALESGVITR